MHKSQSEIVKMDAKEIKYWMAYDMLKDEEFNKKVQLSINSDKSEKEKAYDLKNFFLNLKGGRK